MVLIRLQAYSAKRSLAFAAALVILSLVSCFGGSILFTVENTPYDRQMERIRPILVAIPDPAPENLSFGRVKRWMKVLRGVPYAYSDEWKKPSEIAQAAVADCKGKAVSLYAIMHERGARDLRLVVGKRMRSSQVTHTWLEWTIGSTTYVLDPTWSDSPWAKTQLPPDSYLTEFVYAGNQKFRACPTDAFLVNL